MIGSSSQAAEAAPPRQSVHWAAAGLTPQPETGDMRCHYPFIETTPTHHTFGGAFLPSFSTHQQLTISFTKSIDPVCQSAISFINIHFRILHTNLRFCHLPFIYILHFCRVVPHLPAPFHASTTLNLVTRGLIISMLHYPLCQHILTPQP